jgi:hypothetical protein
MITDPSRWAVWHTVHPLIVAVTRPHVRFDRIATLTTKSTPLACRYPSTTRKVGLLTIDRIRDPPTAQELKRRVDRSSMRSTSKRVSPTRPTRAPSHYVLDKLPVFVNCGSPIGLLPAHHPIFGITFSRPRCNAAHVLRNHRGVGKLLRAAALRGFTVSCQGPRQLGTRTSPCSAFEINQYGLPEINID